MDWWAAVRTITRNPQIQVGELYTLVVKNKSPSLLEAGLITCEFEGYPSRGCV